MTLEELQIKFTADVAGLKAELNDVKKSVGGLEAPTGKATGALGGLAKMGGMIAAAGIGVKLVGIGKEALAMANEVTESESLFEVSMGNMADDARAWSDELSKSLGVNAYEARRNVGVLNTMFKSMGLGTVEASDMAKSLTMLSQDMASFYNLDPTEAFTKLQAGITGEAQGLKRLGIMIDENTVQQYALRKGIIKEGQAMTAQQKVMARYGAIVEQTGDAQGDLARTMESPSNQLRKLNNEFDQAKIALGQALQPALIAVLPVLTSLASGAKSAVEALSGIGGKGSSFTDITVTIEEATSDISDAVDMGFVDAVAKINALKAKTDAAIENFIATEKKTKKIAIEISLDEPTTTGQERITTAIDALKALVPETVNTNPINTRLNAILKDGVVTEAEKGGLSKWLNSWAERSIKAINIEAAKRTKEIDALVKSGKIDEAEGTDLKAEVTEWAQTAIGEVKATVNTINAEVGAGAESLTTVSFSPEQAEKLSSAITAGIEASNLTANAAVDQVTAIFDNTDVIGVAVGTLYSGLQEQVTALNGELSAILSKWSEGLEAPTSEDWARVMEIRAEREALIAALSGGLTSGGKLTGELVNLELNADSIKNYFKAYTEAFTAESNSAAQKLEAQKEILLNIASDPMLADRFSEIMAGLGFEGMDIEGAIASLEQQIADALNMGKSKAIMDAAARLMPSIAAAIASGDTGEIQTAMEGLTALLTSIGDDFANLTPEAQAEIANMIAAFSGIDGIGMQVQNAFNQAKQDVLIGMSGLKELFGEGASLAIASLQEGLRQGQISQSDFEAIIGAANSKSALERLAVEFRRKGNNAAASLIEGLISQIPNVIATGKQVADAAADGFGSGGGGKSIGANLGQGFIDGINSKRAGAISAARSMAQAAMDEMKDVLDINSPSEVTKGLGSYFGEGFVIGMQDMAGAIYRTSAGLASDAVAGIQGAQGAIGLGVNGFADVGVSGAIAQGIAQGVSDVMNRLQIEMNLDGERLGRASIKAINGVMSRSGRTLLNVGGT